MNAPTPAIQSEFELIQRLVSEVRALIGETTSLFARIDNRITVNPETIEQIKAALQAYDDCAGGLAGKALVKTTITDGHSIVLEMRILVSPSQAKALAKSLVSHAEKAASGKSSPSRSGSEVKKIRFARIKDKYGFLSNFARSPILLKGKLWPSVEHYFQAQKFTGTKYEDEIRTALSPAAAAFMGRDRAKPLRLDWETVKLDIMREALWAKFTQHRKLRESLLATGDAVLIEHTRNNYWGDGGNGSGRNMLGRLLMETRARLRQEERPKQLQKV
jgi:hypothetical protein